MRLTLTAYAAMVGLALASMAVAEETPSTCASPRPPPAETMRPASIGPKPVLPRCINPETPVGSCRHGELQRYNAEVERYNADLATWSTTAAQYVDALNVWLRVADRYGQCEIQTLNARTPH